MAQWIVFHLTDRCPRTCLHCLRDPAARATDLPLELFERALDQVGPLHGVSHVGLTGGEPLIHPQFAEVMGSIARRGFTWHVVTSGHRFERLIALVDELPALRTGLRLVNLSVDGAEAATHDAIRGPGGFREAMTAVAACRARGLPFCANMTVNAVNEGELERVGLLGAELGAAKVSFSMTQATGTADDARLYLAPAQLDRVRDRVERLGDVLRIPVQAAEGFHRAERLRACEPFRTDVLHVDPRGRLNLCCNHSGVPGGEEDVVADLASSSLAEAHGRLLDLVHRLRREQLARAAQGPAGGWEALQCNECLRRLGKPHWVDGGSAGPPARRPARSQG